MAVSASEITQRYRKLKEAFDEEGLLRFEDEYKEDPRASVKKTAESAGKAAAAIRAEKDREERMRQFEHQCEKEGYTLICGIDEAGRGPLAGPVVAGAVILPRDCVIPGLNDSKKLSPKKRDELYDRIREEAVAVGVGSIGPDRIDEINILQADYEAMCEAIGSLSVMPQILLNDAVKIPQVLIPQIPIIHGDARSMSIAAASVIAKVTRDRLMDEFDAVYPEYGFSKHKGYGTAGHYAALRKYGPCPIHRKTFLKTMH